jgi:hypothetical protein
MGERRGVYRVLDGKPETETNLEDPSVDGWIKLRWIFAKWNVRKWTGSIWLRIETNGWHL